MNKECIVVGMTILSTVNQAVSVESVVAVGQIG